MAKTRKQSRRPPTRPAPAGQRRPAGAQARPTAQNPNRNRRPNRRRNRNKQLGYASIAVVIVAAVVFFIVHATGGPTNTGPDAAGRHPAAATANIVGPVTTIPATAFDSVGTAGMAAAFTRTANQPALTESGLPRFVYDGAEFCPYCAMARWSMVAALARFGTFTGLKQTSSASDDGDVPTFSFLDSTYKSPYLVFTPYEDEDRNSQPLQTVPADVQALYTKYDGNAAGTASKFVQAEGIPFMDIANAYVSAGTPGQFASAVLPALTDGGPGITAIAQAMHDPSSTIGQSIGVKYLVAEANWITGAICNTDGAKPASVCSTSGVMAASKALKASAAVG